MDGLIKGIEARENRREKCIKRNQWSNTILAYFFRCWLGDSSLLLMANVLHINLDTLFFIRGNMKSVTPYLTKPSHKVSRFIKVVLNHVYASKSVHLL